MVKILTDCGHVEELLERVLFEERLVVGFDVGLVQNLADVSRTVSDLFFCVSKLVSEETVPSTLLLQNLLGNIHTSGCNLAWVPLKVFAVDDSQLDEVLCIDIANVIDFMQFGESVQES